MSFRQPFRATPIKLGKHYRRKQQVEQHKTILTYLGLAAIVGAVAGVGSVAFDRADVGVPTSLKGLAVSTGMMRARAPAEGDYWSGCDEARIAGSAPIYMGEPGYREGLDGDNDGVACEPYRGR